MLMVGTIFVMSIDTTQSYLADRLKCWLNGVSQTVTFTLVHQTYLKILIGYLIKILHTDGVEQIIVIGMV